MKTAHDYLLELSPLMSADVALAVQSYGQLCRIEGAREMLLEVKLLYKRNECHKCGGLFSASEMETAEVASGKENFCKECIKTIQ